MEETFTPYPAKKSPPIQTERSTTVLDEMLGPTLATRKVQRLPSFYSKLRSQMRHNKQLVLTC